MQNFDETKAENIAKLKDLIQNLRVAMLTTQDRESKLTSRPMLVQGVEGENVWFFTDRQSGKILSIREHQEVNLGFASPENQQFVSVAGTATLIDSRPKMKELWTEEQRPYFPNGAEDENLQLIKVRIDSAEYWDRPSSKAQQLFSRVRSAVSGKNFAEGENARLDLH